jgi:hypothetical protein
VLTYLIISPTKSKELFLHYVGLVSIHNLVNFLIRVGQPSWMGGISWL